MAKKSIAKNYIYNLIYQLLTILLPLITTPYLSRVLGAEPIGIYGYILSIVTYFILFGSLGIAMYGQREIAYLQNDKQKRSKTFWEICIIRFIMLTVAIILFYFAFANKGEYSIYYKILILYIISNAIDITWLLQGLEEFDKTVVRNIVVKFLSLVCIFIFIKEPTDLWKYILIYSLAELLGNVTMWMYLPKYIEKVKIKSLQLLKHIKPTIALFVPQIAIQIYTVLDKTMIGNILGDMTQVGLYEQAQKIIRAEIVIATAMNAVMSSRIANIYVTGKKEDIVKELKKSFSFVMLLGIPMMFGTMAIANKMVPWFYGEGFEKVGPLLIAFSPIILVIGLSNITGIQYLIPTKKQNQFTITVTIGAIINVVLNFILIKLVGAIGAVISSVLSEVAILIAQIFIIRKEVNILEMLKPAIKYLISGVLMYVVVLNLASIINVSIINTVIQVIVGTIIYFIALILLKDRFLGDIINQIFSNIKGKVGKL